MFLGEITRQRIFIKISQEKKKTEKMIGSSVKDFESFCQKPLEVILYKDYRQPVCFGPNHAAQEATEWSVM